MRAWRAPCAERVDVTRANVEAVLKPPVAASSARAPRNGHGAPAPDELVSARQSARGNVTQVAARYRKGAKEIYRWLKGHAIDPDVYR